MSPTTLNGDARLETLSMFPLVFLNRRFRRPQILVGASLLAGSCVLGKHDWIQVTAALLH